MTIVPEPDELTRPYWDGARRRELLLQHCRGCDNRWHPPGPICPRCQSMDCDWEPAAGGGTVHSFTVVHHAAHASVKEHVPYLVAVVMLDEGPRFISNILCPIGRVAIGMRVRLVFQTLAEGIVIPQFEPEEGA